MSLSTSSSKSSCEDQTVNRAKDITICSLMSENSKLRKSCKDLRQRLVFEKKKQFAFSNRKHKGKKSIVVD